MKDHQLPGFLMVLVLLLFLIGVSGLVAAQAQPTLAKAPAFPNASPGDAVLSITGSALNPRTDKMNYYSTYTGGGLYCTEALGLPVFNTPVVLPQGTVVKSLRMYFYDNVEDARCFSYFSVYDLYGNLVADWSAQSPASTVIGGYDYADSPVINHTIDYTQYTYLLNWVASPVGSAMQLLSLQLNYKPAPGRAAVIPLF